MKSYFHLQLHSWWDPPKVNPGNTNLSLSRRLHEHQIKFFSFKWHLHQEKGIMLSRASRDTDCIDIPLHLFPCATLPGANTRIAQYLLMMYLIHKLFHNFFFFFLVIDLVAARESIVLLRNTAGLPMTMENCWQMYGNLEENTSAPLMEAGQRGKTLQEKHGVSGRFFPLCCSKPCALQDGKLSVVPTNTTGLLTCRQVLQEGKH